MDFKLEAEVNKNIDDVWEVMGNQFGDISKWASISINSKVGGSTKLADVNYGYRLLESKKGIAKHVLTTFDPPNHSLTYDVPEGTPFFVKSAKASWALTALGDNKTKLNVHFMVQLSGLLGFILAPVAKKKLGAVSDNIIEEFKYYAENGTPHPRKLQSQTS